MTNANHEIAVFGGGCFWCTEATFTMLKGVISVVPGYTGGKSINPTYDEVSTGQTGHVEVIKIVFDPSIVSYADLLTVFFNTHDPTTLNRQGNDVGTQYRSVIFYANEAQKYEAEHLVKELNEKHAYGKDVVTEVVSLANFYEAEEYHRDYFKNHPGDAYCSIVIAPKLEKMQKRFADLIK
ncbi:MAG: peptide-methionine (S)-S-oxide reductase MsrA [Candidatus Paceibacterota bacterium]|jgi:peptide-methionine (S)-S-oxide reductase